MARGGASAALGGGVAAGVAAAGVEAAGVVASVGVSSAGTTAAGVALASLGEHDAVPVVQWSSRSMAAAVWPQRQCGPTT